MQGVPLASEQKGNCDWGGGERKPSLLSLACLQGDQLHERVHPEVEDLETDSFKTNQVLESLLILRLKTADQQIEIL